MPNPFDWDYLTTQPISGDVLDGFTIVYAALFALGFIASAYFYYRPWSPPVGKVFRRRSVVTATGVAMWVFGIGLFFFLIRILQINPFTFGEPIWMWLSILGVVAMFVVIGLRWQGARHRVGQPATTVDARGRTVAPKAGVPKTRPVRRDRAHR